MRSATPEDFVRSRARALGFDLVGIAQAVPPDHWDVYTDWLAGGMAGEMSYLGRNLERRGDPRQVLPGARSIVCVGLNYACEPAGDPAPAGAGQIAQYARGDDYHEVMKGRLARLLEEIRDEMPGVEGKVYVDTGPVLERDFAARAGLGWFGKNTNLIHRKTGSLFFLGEILLTADLAPDAPATDHCGTCTRCLDACPTDALPAPYVLDSNRCISYLTIELKGPIPRDLRPKLGDWIYGCDICQDVCPWNVKHARPTSEEALQPRPGFSRPNLRDTMAMDQEAFSRSFRGSPIKRTKRRGLLRNTAVALGNKGGPEDIPALAAALSDPEPLVRGHVAWALGQIGGETAMAALVGARPSESDLGVLDEIDAALDRLRQAKEKHHPKAKDRTSTG